MKYYISQGRVETPIRIDGLQFCWKFTTLVSLCQKLSKYNTVWQSYCKNKKEQFFCPTV